MRFKYRPLLEGELSHPFTLSVPVCFVTSDLNNMPWPKAQQRIAAQLNAAVHAFRETILANITYGVPENSTIGIGVYTDPVWEYTEGLSVPLYDDKDLDGYGNPVEDAEPVRYSTETRGWLLKGAFDVRPHHPDWADGLPLSTQLIKPSDISALLSPKDYAKLAASLSRILTP